MTRLRVVLVVLLVSAAYWAALPWIDCARAALPFGPGVPLCTFGAPELGSAPTWGFWPNILFGVAYLIAAVLVAARRRPL